MWVQELREQINLYLLKTKTKTKTCKHPQCPLQHYLQQSRQGSNLCLPVDEWTKMYIHVVYIHMVEYYSAIKKILAIYDSMGGP